ncbi:MAG: RNA polymerase-associated protein RapA [Promethearchaeota archaeon]|nr:MAG: RNA polymerase-associated protein RapA [Candidatus Lokiarchaeota archaeon]
MKMNIDKQLELTYIPSKYWNEKASGFSLISASKKVPTDASFFLIWIPFQDSEESLEKKMQEKMRDIPINKLLSCTIHLALPNSNNSDSYKEFQIQNVYGKILPLLPASNYLNKLEVFENEENKPTVRSFSGSVTTWALLTKLTFELLNRGDFLPVMDKSTEKSYTGRWHVLLKDPYDYERFQKILQNCPFTAYSLPATMDQKSRTAPSKNELLVKELWHPSFLFSDYMETLGDILVRSILIKNKFKTFEEFYNSEILKEKNREYNLSWDYKFLKSLLKKDTNFQIQQFHETIVPKLIKNWVNISNISPLGYGIRLALKLDFPDSNQEEWPLGLYLSFQNGKNLIPLSEVLKGEVTLTSEQKDYFKSKENLMELLLRSLGRIIKIYPPAQYALNGAYPATLLLTSSEVMEFLSYPKDLLIQSGFRVILPEVFQSGGKQRLSARMIIYSEEGEYKDKESTSSTMTPLFQLNEMLQYQWEGELGDTKLEKKELEYIINQNQLLINLKDEWVLIDQQDLENIKAIFNPSTSIGKYSQPEGIIKYMDALKLGLSQKVELEPAGLNYKVLIKGSFKNIVDKIKTLENFSKISQPDSFNGTLRAYQKTGLTWMANLSELGFGMCLADDMGLGKTIQVIALLLHFKEKYPTSMNSVLIICPTSVIYNWKRELRRFGPDLDVILHHGLDRVKDLSEISQYTKPHRVVLTTFGTIRNDVDLLKTIRFTGIVVDESQNMKNYETQQTQAIYQLQSHYKICLSGTPIENRLLELWTLFEFLNPGLLGIRKSFREDYIIPIERFHDKEAAENLKKIIAPFILRRTKSDKSIIKDLPEKNEIKIYVELSKTQFTLYKKEVEETLKRIKSASDTNKNKSMYILTLLTKLKQICNHPYQFLHKPITSKDLKKNFKDFISMSPKLERLFEMIDEVINNNEKAIIFTQFTQMGDILETVLSYKYEFPVLYFHGGVPAEKRKKIIDKFQSNNKDSPPLLILSLRAGGTGLNLTKATTVFHFDRWWNPAVERQATDRAYRIGQKENVNVYKFITLNSIEEKIDTLIEEKEELADMVISSGESWISQLTDDKIKALLSLE